MTGRGMGVCGSDTGFNTMMGRGGGRGGGRCRFANSGRQMAGGRGGGMGQGLGAGLGAVRFGAPQGEAVVEDKAALQAAYEATQNNLARLKERLDALEKSSGDGQAE